MYRGFQEVESLRASGADVIQIQQYDSSREKRLNMRVFRGPARLGEAVRNPLKSAAARPTMDAQSAGHGDLPGP